MKTRVVISVTNEIAYDQRMLKTAQTLVNNGFDVSIVGRMKSSNSSSEFIDLPFNTHRFNLIFSKGKFFYLEYNLRLFFYLLFQSADIYCAVDLDTILPNFIICKLKGKPLIYDAHEYFTEVPELQGRKFEKSIWKFIERRVIPYCDKIYTVSQGIAEIFQDEYEKQVEVICNFSRNQTKSNDVYEENIIIYQGDLNEGRGLEMAIRAMDKLPDWKLWIVGDGYHRKLLESITDHLLFKERVVFWGKKTPLELKDLTSKAKFGINLLENRGLNYYYSLANKYFDFIQAGVVPISMNFPEYRRIQEKYACSILIERLDESEYLTSLQSIIRDENNYYHLVKNCDIAASFLTWENQEKKLCSIYNNV